MKTVGFRAFCPFEMGDEVRIILGYREGKPAYTEDSYRVDDITAIHSVKTGAVTFELILADSKGRILHPRTPDKVQRVATIKEIEEEENKMKYGISLSTVVCPTCKKGNFVTVDDTEKCNICGAVLTEEIVQSELDRAWEDHQAGRV